jgi:hypothetical protein
MNDNEKRKGVEMSRTVEEVQADLRAFTNGEVKPTFDRWSETLNALIQELTDLLPGDADDEISKLATGEKAPTHAWAVLDRVIDVNEHLLGEVERSLARTAALEHEEALREWAEKKVVNKVEDKAARGVVLGLLTQVRIIQPRGSENVTGIEQQD